jgi:ABC-type antimicrobial peptide transport system, ATPase component
MDTSAGEKVALITTKSLTKRYRVGGHDLLATDNVSITINQGEFVAIIGESGSGKSTLLQLLGGLDKPTSGSVTIGGVDITNLSDGKLSKFRNQTIGFVFQSFYLQPFLTLRRNIEVAAMPSRMKRDTRRARTDRLAEQVGLADRLDYYPRQLSGGQIQRAAIARALFNKPPILLADEPTGNLDSQNSRGIIALFRQICDGWGTTVVVVTHSREVAMVADRVVTVKDGAIV